MSLSNNIKQARQEQNLTQEQLAELLSVSAQAVSKWENGGCPDCELLPKIADFLEVSLDHLFSRKLENFSDIRTELVRAIGSQPQEDRFKVAAEYCWVIEMALMSDNWITLEEQLERIGNNHNFSQIWYDSGFSSFSLNKQLPYFMLLPEPEGGYRNGLFKKEDYVRLFRFLGEDGVLDCLFLLQERDYKKPFTPALLEKELGLSPERAREILTKLKDYCFVKERELELDDHILSIYDFINNPALVMVLALSKELISKPGSFNGFCDGRNRPIFQ